MAEEHEENPQRRKTQELVTLGAQVAAVAAALLGAVLVTLSASFVVWGVLVFTLGLGFQIVSQVASFNINVYRFVGSESRGSTRYERMRRWTRLKTSSALHSLIILLGLALVLTGMMGRMGIIQLNLTTYQGDRALAAFLAALTLNSVFAHHQSLFVKLEADRTAATRNLFWTGVNFAFIVAAFAAFIDYNQVNLSFGGMDLRPGDAMVLLVAAYSISALLLTVGRGLPSILSVVSDPRTQSRGGYVSRTKAVVMPTVVAFTLLLVFVLLIVVFGAGIFTVLSEVGRRPSVVVVLALMVIAVVAGLTISVQLARQEDKIELFRRLPSREQKVQTTILAVSLSMAVALLGLALAANRGDGVGPFSRGSWIDLTAFGLMVGVGPFGFYTARRQNHIQQMEARFPDLLRDLASSHKGGLTLVQAAQVAARGDYGALTPEVQRLADQLTWHISFEEALSRLAERVHTPLVRRSVSLVLEAARSGGNTTDVLLAAARDAREIKTLERERRLNMSVYTTVIYVTFFVFLFVIAILVGQFLPEVVKASETAATSTLDPATAGLDLSGVGEQEYRQFYFLAGIVQAVGNGVLAGVMGTGKASLGLRHAFFMVLATYLTFAFII